MLSIGQVLQEAATPNLPGGHLSDGATHRMVGGGTERLRQAMRGHLYDALLRLGGSEEGERYVSWVDRTASLRRRFQLHGGVGVSEVAGPCRRHWVQQRRNLEP